MGSSSKSNFENSSNSSYRVRNANPSSKSLSNVPSAIRKKNINKAGKFYFASSEPNK